jgi:hypothetical protein
LPREKVHEEQKLLALQGFLNKSSNVLNASSFSLPEDVAEDSLKVK